MTQGRAERSACLLGLAGLVAVVLAWALRDVLILITFALLLAYVLDPPVSALERVRLPRGGRIPRELASGLVMLALVALLVWALAVALPRLAGEITGFVQRIPGALDRLLTETRVWATSRGWGAQVDPALENLKASLPEMIRAGALGLTRWVGSLSSGLAQGVGLLVLPLFTYYLLAEREDVRASLVQFVPERWHARLDAAGRALERAFKSYVRGQVLVCLINGAIVGTVLAVLGFPLVLLLAVIVAIAEVVPYLGALLAAIAIGIAGYSERPGLALIGVIVYLVLNNLIALFVTPRIMGRYLKLHPFVVLASVLAGGQLLGPAGVMLALPGAAVVQSLFREFAPRRGKPAR